LVAKKNTSVGHVRKVRSKSAQESCHVRWPRVKSEISIVDRAKGSWSCVKRAVDRAKAREVRRSVESRESARRALEIFDKVKRALCRISTGLYSEKKGLLVSISMEEDHEGLELPPW
jgi:hypothetical protein